jgi:serine/threonine protein kinase
LTERLPPSELGEEDLDSRVDELLRRVAHISKAALAQTWSLADSAPETSASGAPGASAEHPAPGTVVDDRYRIEAVLGEGAMGVVLAARNLRTGREVALKYMLGSRDEPQLRRCARIERFVREAQAVGRVRDPHVVDIYDVGGELETPYLVMERLHGQSLGARMKEHRVPQDELVRYAIEAAQGVAAAHRQGVIHRDLKPDNLFLARDERGEECVKVLDFGVSRIRDESVPLATITRSGSVIGTPAYMPLEQLRGEQELDARADVYALGAIMYEALSGRLPFESRTLHDLVLAMANDSPASLASVAREVEPWLCDVVMKCLAREPAQRFADMNALIQALRTRAPGAIVKTSPPAARNAASRARRLAKPVLLALLALLFALAWFLRARDEPAARDLRAPQPAAQAAPVSAPPAPPPLAPSAPDSKVRSDVAESPAPAAQSPQEDRAPPQRNRSDSHPERVRRARDLRLDDF